MIQSTLGQPILCDDVTTPATESLHEGDPASGGRRDDAARDRVRHGEHDAVGMGKLHTLTLTPLFRTRR